MVRWIAAILVVMTTITTPASAQFGGLKKRLKSAAASQGASAVATSAAAGPAAQAEPAESGDAGMIVLTSDVVDRLLTGLKAGEAERAKAAHEDTPYGRYQQARAAFAVAQPKCAQAQQTFPQRMAANEKLMARWRRS